MANGGTSSLMWLFLAIVSFVLALLSFFGVFLASDPVARWIFGVVWVAIGILWIVRYSRSRSQTK